MNASLQIDLPIEDGNAIALREYVAVMREQERATASIQEELPAAIAQLSHAIQFRSGGSCKLAALVWSLWNGDHVVGLWDCLAGIDVSNGGAILSLIRARLVLGGDADSAIRQILENSGEMDRYREAERRTSQNKPVPYPLPFTSSQRLRELLEMV